MWGLNEDRGVSGLVPEFLVRLPQGENPAGRLLPGESKGKKPEKSVPIFARWIKLFR